LAGNLSQCYSLYQKTHLECHGIKPGPRIVKPATKSRRGKSFPSAVNPLVAYQQFLSVTQSQCRTIPMSHSPNVTQSQCHSVPMSHTPNVTQSQYHTVQISHSPNITQSQYHTVPMSHSPNITQSQCHTLPMSLSPNITHSQCHTVPMSHSPNITQSQYHTVPVSHSPNVTQSQCHTQYIHSISINPIHIALFNSTNLISQYFPSVQAVPQLPFLANRYTLQHNFVYRHTILSSWFYNDTFLPCL